MNKCRPVSICIPFYNAERFIERCAVSLFEQTCPDIEYVFVNDCSNDMSVHILNTVLNRYPERSSDVKLIDHNANKGIAAARNTALEHCSGEFILWVDSDDYIEKNAIELLLCTQRKHSSDIVFFNAIIHTKHKCDALRFSSNITKYDLIHSVLSRKYPPYIWLFMVRQKLYADNNIKAIDGINNGEDYLITPRLLYYANIVTHLNYSLYHYDNTRYDSLSGLFSFQRADQEWKATLLLENFFSNKEKRYQEAIKIAKLSRLLNTIKTICKGYGNKQDFERYNAIKKSIPNRHLKEIPLKYIPLMIINDFTSARFYVRSAAYVKNLLTIY